jgi:hypothetical protein
MTRWLPLLVFAAGAVSAADARAQRGQSQGPPLPYEDVGACPFEGCVYREWIAKAAVVVRTSRGVKAPVAFRLQKGERVQAITGVVVTERPGRVQFRAAVDLTAYSYTSGPQRIHIEPTDTLYLLTYRGEGASAAWFNGRLYDEVDASAFFNSACTDNGASCAGRIVEQPVSVWWIQLKNKAGSIGWTNEPDKFDNKDALG